MAAIRQWCISELDGEMLVEATSAQRPKRILEVGTYVGVSTLLMALAEPTATIVTIDPNLPLGLEMGSMGSDLGTLRDTVRTHEVARIAARQLGVENHIEFVEGGFAIGDTFSSMGNGPGARVPVVGPAVCAKHGPFDLIFIDGLHYVSVVEADLRLAAEALAPSGVILMHDCIGMWGTNVRAGIFRFLADRPEFRLCHPRFSELYRSIGTVFRADERPDLMKRFRSSEPDASAIHAATRSIAFSTIRRIEPDFVVELVAATGALKSTLKTTDVPAATVEAPLRDGCVRLDNALGEVAKAWQSARGCDRLLLSFGLIDHLSEAQVRELLGWIRDHDVLAAFGFTPPGEAGVAGRNSRSLRYMVRLGGQTGVSLAALSRFDMDAVQFAFAGAPNEWTASSFCVHTALMGSKERIAKVERRFEPPILALCEVQAEAFEQESLLRLHYSCGFDWAFSQLSASRDLRREVQEQVARSQDLVRQLQQQLARSEDLVRQIGAYQAVLDERQQVEAELRRQLEEQVARSEDLVRQIAAYRAALEERQQVEAELRRQLKQ
jgi:predicted O-methyltransferase YrrM